jgi:hypothetical protein
MQPRSPRLRVCRSDQTTAADAGKGSLRFTAQFQHLGCTVSGSPNTHLRHGPWSTVPPTTWLPMSSPSPLCARKSRSSLIFSESRSHLQLEGEYWVSNLTVSLYLLTLRTYHFISDSPYINVTAHVHISVGLLFTPTEMWVTHYNHLILLLIVPSRIYFI